MNFKEQALVLYEFICYVYLFFTYLCNIDFIHWKTQPQEVVSSNNSIHDKDQFVNKGIKMPIVRHAGMLYFKNKSGLYFL